MRFLQIGAGGGKGFSDDDVTIVFSVSSATHSSHRGMHVSLFRGHGLSVPSSLSLLFSAVLSFGVLPACLPSTAADLIISKKKTKKTKKKENE